MTEPSANVPFDPIEDLLVKALDRLQESGPAALEPFLAQHPEHRRELEAEIARLETLGLMGARETTDSPERVGDFRLLREIGRGGMGVVFEAEQASLGRRVAVKLVRPELAFHEHSRERFRREVAAAAGLAHPGIAQVFAVGDEGGVPWFAMELVEGVSLAGLVDTFAGRAPAGIEGASLKAEIERRLGPASDSSGVGTPVLEGPWITVALRLARQVAESLEHAHGRGVVHRDVKPSNVLVTRSGRAILVDFGLALREEAGRMTRTGAQPGSLPYMAPEQLAGERVDARADVYSLGATLYELLALKPAFAGSAEEIRTRIAAGQVVRLSHLSGAISAEVETVVATAMERDPARRYPTAGDFARDIGNLIERRPIDARPPGLALRFVRWNQRHPRTAAAGFGAIVVGLVASLFFLDRERDHASSLRVERDLARALSVELQDIASGLVRELHEAIADVPGATAARETLVARATELLERLRERGFDDPELTRELANAHLRLADVLGIGSSNLGDSEGALEHALAARELLEGLADPSPSDLGQLRHALVMEAGIRRWAGELEQSDDLTLAALELAREVVAAVPDDPEARLGLVTALVTRQAHVRSQEAGADVDLLLEAVREGHALDAEGGAGASGRRMLCQALRDLASARANQARTAEALELYRDAEAVARALLEAEPDSASGRRLLSHTLEGQGLQLRRMGRVPECAEAYGDAERELEALAALDPADVQAVEDRARLVGRLGQARVLLGDPEGAIEAMRRAAEAVEAALARNSSPSLAYELASLLSELARVQLDLERAEDARPILARATEVLDELERASPGAPNLLEARFDLLCEQVRLCRADGDGEGELRAARGRVAALRGVLAAGPRNVSARANLAMSESELADLETDPAVALETHDRAVALLRGLREDDPADARVVRSLVWLLLRRSGARYSAEDFAGTEEDCAEAGELAAALLEQNPADARLRQYVEEARGGVEAARAAQLGSKP